MNSNVVLSFVPSKTSAFGVLLAFSLIVVPGRDGLAADAVPACPEAKDWRLVPGLSDEFDGTSLDAAKWADWCASFPGRSADGAFGSPCANGFRFSPDNVAVADGELVLTARLLSDAEKTHENEYLRRAPWSTAIVKSRQKQCYGCFEIRAKVMKACVSNAFWLYDPHSDEPKVKFAAGDVSEEIDVFESKGAPSFPDGKTAGLNRFIGTMHFYCTPYLEGVVNGRKRTDADCAAARQDLDFNLADDYHVYTFVWTPERLAWYLDGRLVSARPNDGRYHRPLHVTLDAEVFTGWFGTPDPATLPAKFRIDYVRTWACPPPRNTAVLPRRKIEPDCYDWFERHDRALETAKVRNPEIVFVGDSITHFWAGRDSLGGEEALPRWKAAFGKWRTLNLGYGWDRTGNVLWRLDHGELDGIDPKLVVVHIGGNNFAMTRHYAANTAEETAEGVLAVVDRIRAKLPRTKIVVMGIFPFGEKPGDPRRVKARTANGLIAAAVAARTDTAFVDITDKLIGADGLYPKSLAKDFVHPTDAGYDRWLEALKPHLPEQEAK